MDYVQFQGKVIRVIFEAPDSDFCVLHMQKENGEKVVVKGAVHAPYRGQKLSINGHIEEHLIHGSQCTADSIIQHIPYEYTELVTFLSSGRVSGIGPVIARRMAQHFDDELVTIFRNESFEKLQVVEGISEKRIIALRKSWTMQRALTEIMIFLQSKGISIAYGLRICKVYRGDALHVLTNEPYSLLGKVPGIGFAILDSIAQQVGIESDDKRRVSAALLYEHEQNTNQGNVYSKYEDLLVKSAKLLSFEPHDKKIHDALEILIQNNIFVKVIHEGHTYVALEHDYNLEQEIGSRCSCRCVKMQKLSVDKDLIDKISLDKNLHEEQKKALIASFSSYLSIITGAPGTGKTTVLRALIEIATHSHMKVLLAAPTGRAAKRVSESTGQCAVTLHRLLEWNPLNKSFNKNEKNTLSANIVVIDEASMLDMELMTSVLRSLHAGTRLVLVGDVDQLPSIQKGAILHDLIASKSIPVTHLTHIFRQESGSMIISHAQCINNGKIPYFLNNPHDDCVFINEDDSEKFTQHVQRIITDFLPVRGLSSSTMQIIAPMYRGKAGANATNKALQKFFNPAVRIPEGSVHFLKGDKVIQLHNNYEHDVFNGDGGVVVAIDDESEVLSVNFDGHVVHYEKERWHELALAYAITVHKSQGSEFDVVIIPMFIEHFIMLDRKLLYTALTRAKKLCIIIGQKKALACAVKKNETKNRCTFLKDFICSL